MRGRGRGSGTKSAFLRRLEAGAGSSPATSSDERTRRRPPVTGSTGPREQVSVIDIHNLHDQAKRFVVGVVLKRMFEDKESRGHGPAAGVHRAGRG